MVERIGGWNCWRSLSEERQAERDRELVRETNIHLGEEAYQRLSPEEKRRVDLYVWSGRGTHKDPNAAKGGAEWMPERREKSGETPPVELMSEFKEQAAAATAPENEDLQPITHFLRGGYSWVHVPPAFSLLACTAVRRLISP